MFELTIDSVACDAPEDADGDELRLEVSLGGGFREPYEHRTAITSGFSPWKIDKRYPYESGVELKLLTEPSSPDAGLGTATIEATATSSGSATFAAGANYTLSYSVTEDPNLDPIQSALDDFQRSSESGRWTHITKKQVYDQLEHVTEPLIQGNDVDSDTPGGVGHGTSDQYEIAQDTTPFCGPIATVFGFAYRTPRRFVDVVRSLYEHGAFLGRTERLAASSQLRSSPLPDGFQFATHIDRAPDWMLAAVLREFENVIPFPVTSEFFLDGPGSFLFAATPWEVTSWLEELLGFRTEINWSLVAGEAEALNAAGQAHANDGVGILLIESRLLDFPTDPPFFRYPNHYVTILTDNPHRDSNGTVDFECQTWAETRSVQKNFPYFENFMYGSITGEPADLPVLSEWLGSNTAIRDAIVWEEPGGSTVGYDSWSSSKREALQKAFEAAVFGRSSGVPDPPPNANEPHLEPDDDPLTYIEESHAWPLYLATVGHSLAAEIDDRVPWSVTGYDGADLARLFDSREFFYWHEFAGEDYTVKGYRIDQSKAGKVTPTPPHAVMSFLQDNSIVGADRRETIVALLDWCRNNLAHFGGDDTTENFDDRWQYEGYPPVSRMISGTQQTSDPSAGTKHRTAGCWGTCGFLRSVLQIVNVPVAIEGFGGHVLPHFTTESLYLSHGDDPYNDHLKYTPAGTIPTADLLIDQRTYDDWFGSDVPEDKRKENVDRRVYELAVQHLSVPLLNKRCDDRKNRRSKADSCVLASLSDYYTQAELEAKNLWSRLDAEIASRGGCANVPPTG